jgi:MFS family permease
VVGAVAGFSIGMIVAAVVTPFLSRVVSTDGEGWEILWVWVLGAFGGIAIGALVGLVLGVRRRPAAEIPAPPRPDAS